MVWLRTGKGLASPWTTQRRIGELIVRWRAQGQENPESDKEEEVVPSRVSDALIWVLQNDAQRAGLCWHSSATMIQMMRSQPKKKKDVRVWRCTLKKFGGSKFDPIAFSEATVPSPASLCGCIRAGLVG
mmetsp:Transcript_35201/g.59038  ORF Transcript_35201/g.59038 Transcript_35201/m.59038 type:complete len:129 (+) Transcript_35201:1680-2066(+)